jgi:hypothetical protein
MAVDPTGESDLTGATDGDRSSVRRAEPGRDSPPTSGETRSCTVRNLITIVLVNLPKFLWSRLLRILALHAIKLALLKKCSLARLVRKKLLSCNHVNLLTCPYSHVNAGKSAHTVHAPVYDPTFRIRSSEEAHWGIDPMEVLGGPSSGSDQV